MEILYYESDSYDLYHHGVKGQKWGVRRYQNADGTLTSAGKIQSKKNRLKNKYDKIENPFMYKYNNPDRKSYFEDTIIEKKSKFQHISKNKNIDLKNDRIYVSNNEIDNSKYTTAMTKEIKNVFDHVAYKHMFESVEDIKIPSKDKCVKIFKKIYNRHKDDTIKDLDEQLNNLYISDDDFAGMVSGYKYDLKRDKVYESAYNLLNLSIGIREMNPHTKTSSRFFEALKKEGYNAIVDEFDNMSALKSELPLIILDAKKTLKETKPSERVTKKMINKAKQLLETADKEFVTYVLEE